MTSEAAIILGLCVLLAIGILAALSRHKKFGTDHLILVGSIGVVDTKLDPQGTILIDGELWNAFSNEPTGLAPGSRIEVVGTRDPLLLVKLLAR